MTETKQQSIEEKQLVIKKKKALWRKIVRFIVVSFLLLCLVIIGSSYYFFNTNEGLKQAINLANRFSGYEIKADGIGGELLGKTELRNLSVKGDALNFYSDNLVLDWESGALFDKSVTVKAISLKNGVIELKPSEEKNAHSEYKPFDLTDIKLPFDLRLEDLLIENLAFRNPITQQADFVLDRLQVGIDYVGQVGKINTFVVQAQGVDLNLTGQIETRGEYPLTLKNSTAYKSSAYGDEIVLMTVDGALKKQLDVSVIGEGVSDFNLDGHIISLLKSPSFSADLSLQKVNTSVFGLIDTAVGAKISAKGQLDKTLQLNSKGTIDYHSPETDKVKVTFDSDFDGDQFIIPALAIEFLTAKQKLTGRGFYHLTDKTLDVKLTSDKVQYPQVNPSIIAKKLQLLIGGSLNNYQIDMTAETDTDAIGTVPIALKANGSMIALKDFSANALIGGKPLDMKGKAMWSPTINYQVNVSAPEILPIKQFPGVKGLNVDVEGDTQNYQAKGSVHLYADAIPPSDIVLDVNGTPKYLDKADVTINTLGGVAKVKANGVLAPLAIVADVTTQHIQPQRFYKEINGDINTALKVNIDQITDNLKVTTSINKLMGQLQGKPLSGQGKVIFDQADNQLSVDKLSVNLAGNKIDANGLLSLDKKGKSDLIADIHAKQLKRLLPGLAGSVSAKLQVKGNVEKPSINGYINGKNIAYQQHKIQQLDTDIDVNLATDRLMINSKAIGVKSGGNVIDNADININGKVSQHQIKASIKTPEKATIPSVILVGNGGLNQQTMTWSGSLQQLNLDSHLAGKWRLAKATPMTLSAENIKISHLCLFQKTAKLCADGQLKQPNGQFKVSMKNLKTKTFAELLPKTVDIDTTLNADTNIILRNGKPDVTGKLVASGGRLKVAAGSGQLDDKIEQLETHFSLKNNRLQADAKGKLKKVGTLNIVAVLPNVSKENVKANVKINTPKLNFLQDLVPQLTNVKGRLTGDMTVSGVPGKQLSVAGKITLHKTDFDVPQFGTQIRAMTLDVFSQNSSQIGFKGGAKAGKGRFDISGYLNPATQHGEIDIKGKDFQVADSRKLKVTINPDLRIVFADGINVRGDLIVPRALIVPESTGSKITVSEDVVLPQHRDKKQAKSSPIDVEVGIKLGDDVRVASADIETKLRGDVKLVAKPGKALTAGGVISIKTGNLRVYGQQLNIQRGRVIFSNGPIANPALDVRAIREIDGESEVTVGVNVLGNVSKPRISLFSTPSMPDSSILSYLLFGKPPNSNSFGTSALLQTGGLVGANTIARDVRSSMGLDVLDISLTGVEAGKNLTKKIYTGVRSNFFDAINQFLLKYKISGKSRIEATVGTDGVSTDYIREFETD